MIPPESASTTLACGLAGEIVRTFGQVRLRVFGTSMVPFLCEKSDVDILDQFVASHPALNPVVYKPMRRTLQDEQRCLKARAFLQATK